MLHLLKRSDLRGSLLQVAVARPPRVPLVSAALILVCTVKLEWRETLRQMR